jgi:hypothetical protein
METIYGKESTFDAFKAAYSIGKPEATSTEIWDEYQTWLSKNHQHQRTPMNGTKVSELFAEYLNSFSDKAPDFIEAIEKLSREHRTLQQSFTKLCLKWIEHIAVPFVWEGNTATGYSVDGRNEASQKTAQKLLKGWEMLGKEDEKNTYGMPPSKWLHMI